MKSWNDTKDVSAARQGRMMTGFSGSLVRGICSTVPAGCEAELLLAVLAVACTPSFSVVTYNVKRPNETRPRPRGAQGKPCTCEKSLWRGTFEVEASAVCRDSAAVKNAIFSLPR